jgi:hypothetical protein
MILGSNWIAGGYLPTTVKYNLQHNHIIYKLQFPITQLAGQKKNDGGRHERMRRDVVTWDEGDG